MQKQANSLTTLKKAHGERADTIARRLQQLQAAPTLAEVEQLGLLHQLTQDRDEEFAVRITGNHRLTFSVGNDPIPRLENGGIDRAKVTDVVIIELCEDYHG